jgi:hypothetical protein
MALHINQSNRIKASIMSAKPNQQKHRASQPNFCANCGTRFPRLNSQQLARHRFCSCCGTPVSYGQHEWLPVTLDEATGTLLHAELKAVNGSSDSTIKQRLVNLGRDPGKMLAMSAGSLAIGGGLILAAAPLAALGVGVAAAGIVLVKTAMVGGIAVGLFAAKTEDRQAVTSLFKMVGMTAAVGLATVVVGGIIGLLAALFPVVGGILAGVGALATVGTIGHQAHLQYQRRQQLIATQKNLGCLFPSTQT